MGCLVTPEGGAGLGQTVLEPIYQRSLESLPPPPLPLPDPAEWRYATGDTETYQGFPVITPLPSETPAAPPAIHTGPAGGIEPSVLQALPTLALQPRVHPGPVTGPSGIDDTTLILLLGAALLLAR